MNFSFRLLDHASVASELKKGPSCSARLFGNTPLNLETAVQDNKAMQDFELEALPMGVDHSQKVKATPIGRAYGSKDYVNLLPSTAVSRLNITSSPIAATWSLSLFPTYKSRSGGLYLSFLCIFFMSLLFLCGGCCSNSGLYTPCDEPPPLPVCHIPQKVKLALVLGGGGAKGFAHIGVLEEFERAGIPIDIIIGCSAGSLVGSLYCDCPNAAYVKTLLEPMNSESFIDIEFLKSWFGLGLSKSNAMTSVLDSCLNANYFDELKIPLLTVATDLYSGELVTFGGGQIIPAVEGSCAFPLVFAPVKHHGRILVDGGVIDPVPVQIAKMVDPEIIVAVDLRCMLDKSFPKNILGVAKRSANISLLWQSEKCLNGADFVIRPELGDVGTFDDCPHQQIYDAGRAAALKVIPLILERLASLDIAT